MARFTLEKTAMALSRRRRVEARLREDAQLRVERRVNVFKDCKPYFGDVLSEVLGEKSPSEVDSLYLLSLRVVIRSRVPYEERQVPTVLRKRLDELRRLVDCPAPMIMKCSNCWTFYTTAEKFNTHKCSQR